MSTVAAIAATLAAVSLAWACAPQGGLTLDRTSGPSGASVTATVTGFTGPVAIRWNALDGPVLASGSGPTIRFTTPSGTAPGTYTVLAATTDEHAVHSVARVPFTITVPTQVRVEDNAFVSPAVAIKPGESVSWSYAGSTDTHNVHFEDNSFTDPPTPSRGPWTSSTRTFDTPGAYRYYCQEHGGPGRRGMSGIVYVNATGTVPGNAPTAAFTVSPSSARVGQNVSFDARGTTDPDAGDTIVRHEWDLDGDGSYETDTGPTPTTTLTYRTAGARTLKLRVTDGQGHATETTQALTVNQPLASFTATPHPARPGQTVSFAASASSEPGGTIAKYEWDLDGNGTYETDTGTAPTASHLYAAAGDVSVKLRVTDDLGVVSETVGVLHVEAGAPLPPPPLSPGAAAVLPGALSPGGTLLKPISKPAGCGSLTGAKRTACEKKSCSRLSGGRRAACIQKSCQRLSRGARSACLRSSCRYLSRSRRSACTRGSCRALKGAQRRACTKKYTHRRR